jgi:hypothetical protein
MPKATNIPKELAEDIDALPDNTVLISINEEHEPLYPLKLDRTNFNILTVKFSDITARREWMGALLVFALLIAQTNVVLSVLLI